MSDSSQPKPIDVTYDEPQTAPRSSNIRLEDIIGTLPRVSAVPTWTPRLFKDGFAFYSNGSTHRFYVYDFTNSVWRFMALT